jgi:hypothetical protein
MSNNKHEVAVAPQKADREAKLAALRKSMSRPEKFILSCACAVRDTGFTAIMERYSQDEQFKLGALEAMSKSFTSASSSQPSAAPKTRDMESISFTGWKCIACGSSDWPIQCMGCKTLVCAGLTKDTPNGRVFHCRASCGLVGQLTKAENISGASGATVSDAARLRLGGKSTATIRNSARLGLPSKK